METCKWSLENEDANNWQSECGHSFWFETGDPTENKMKFCPYCGRKLTQDAADTACAVPQCGLPAKENGFCEFHQLDAVPLI